MSLLYLAMRRNDIEHVKELLALGGNVNERKTGLTPLHFAAFKGKTEIVKILLEYGANTELLDGHGDTPMDYARVNNHRDVVDLLEKQRATH